MGNKNRVRIRWPSYPNKEKETDKGLDVMLKMTRRAGEKLVIGDDVKIYILRIEGEDDEVKIGIDAPKHISVHREEIYKRIQADKAETK